MIAALMIVAVIPLCSQNVVVESRLDSVEMYVGSQAMLTVETTVDSGAELVFPEYRDTVVAGLEVIDRLKPDTVTLNEGKRMTVRHGYMVAAFDSAFFHIPGLKVMVDGREYESNDLVLRVYHFPIDNADPDSLRGIKDIADVPFVVTDAPDVLTVEQIARFTGYTPHTVSRWCTEGRLRTIQRRPRFMVPKVWLLDYLVSDDYNRITRKSGTHYAMIAAVAPKPRKPRKKP